MVVTNVDNAIHPINHYPLDNAIGFPNTHALDSNLSSAGADLGGECRGCAPPPPTEMTCGFLIQLAVFCRKKNYVVYWC